MTAFTTDDCSLDATAPSKAGTANSWAGSPSQAWRWAGWFLGLIALVASFHALHRFFSVKFFRVTGDAQWIWKRHRISSQEPVVFFAARNFTLPESRRYVYIKVAGDPEYTIFFNGREIGGSSSDEVSLDVYDVSNLARTGVNRIVVALRSGNGVGGFLLGVDIAPIVQNLVVSDKSWMITTRWSDSLLSRNPPSPGEDLILLGKPPQGRWNYPLRKEKPLYPDLRYVIHPSNTIPFDTTLPEVRAIGGVAITISRAATATAFDFGPVKGRGRVEIGPSKEKAVLVRYANDEAELQGEGRLHPFVFAEGESEVVDPVERTFRFMVVYDTNAQASVITTR